MKGIAAGRGWVRGPAAERTPPPLTLNARACPRLAAVSVAVASRQLVYVGSLLAHLLACLWHVTAATALIRFVTRMNICARCAGE